MPAVHGLSLSYSSATVAWESGTLDEVRVDDSSEAFTVAAATEFKKSLLVITEAGVISEVTGADTADQDLASAVVPDVPADSYALCVVEMDSSAVTGLDLTVAGDPTPAAG